MKEHKWGEDDFELLFNSITRIIRNQKQIMNGIVALARKEGMEITFKDEDGEVTFEGGENGDK